MPYFEFTPNYLRAIIYSNICSSVFAIILIIIVFGYLYYYDSLQSSIVNYKKITICYLILLLLIGFRSTIEWTSGGVIFDLNCDLFDQNCNGCERQYPIPTILFFVYFIILLFFFTNLYQDIQGLKTIGIQFNKYISFIMLILTLPPMIISILITIKVASVDYISTVVPFGSMEICVYNTEVFSYYDKLLEYNNPIVFSVIILYLIIYLYNFYKIYKDKLNRTLNEPFIKLLLRNVFLSFTYIIVNFATVLTPQYIFRQLPLTGVEYCLTMFVLFLYLPIGNLLYDKIYKYPTDIIIKIITTRTHRYIISQPIELDITQEQEQTEENTKLSHLNQSITEFQV